MDARLDAWTSPNRDVVGTVRDQTRRSLEAYRHNPILVTEHANIERATAQGGYGRRQIYELIQNGADALLNRGVGQGRIHVVLTDDALYCANQGDPIDPEGVESILTSHISLKRGSEIGRFGLGFKSVLGVTRRPRFHSRSGSFAFDAEWAIEQIAEIVPDRDRYPVLRVAMVLDPIEAAIDDEVLAELMRWATTVVKLPRDLGGAKWLPEDIARFPAEFMLFSRHVGQLTLEDRTSNVRRVINVSEQEGVVTLAENDNSGRWRVFERLHRPSSVAREDAGELADRDSLPIAWAVPLHGRPRPGTFWAFFPTEYRTTLSGIVNAPWKTNEDRQGLLTGPFNEELIDRVAGLVVEGLPTLVEVDDPCRYLTLLPARGRETRNWADERITAQVYDLARRSPSMPDSDGDLRIPRDLRLHPPDVSVAALNAWARAPGRPKDWCHISVDLVDRRDRRPRANRLLADEDQDDMGSSVAEWLEALAAAHTPVASAAAVSLAAQLVREDHDFAREVARARVVLTLDGGLVEPARGRVFLPVADMEHDTAIVLVHSSVLLEGSARSDLEDLGVTVADVSATLERLLAETQSTWDEARWTAFWRAVRHVDHDRAVEATVGLRDNGALNVRTFDGSYRPFREVLLPGSVVPRDGSRDGHIAVDVDHHRHDVTLLEQVGLTDGPRVVAIDESSEVYWRYRESARTKFTQSVTELGTPQAGSLVFDQRTTLGPLAALEQLSDEGRALLTEELLTRPEVAIPWVMHHSSVNRREHYGDMEHESFELWAIRHHGMLHTSQCVQPVADCVGAPMRAWGPVLPVVSDDVNGTHVLGLPVSPEELTTGHLQAAMNALEEIDEDRVIGRVLTHVCRSALNVTAPVGIRCRIGETFGSKPPGEVSVAADPDVFSSLRVSAIPVVRVETSPDAELLVDRWGLRAPQDALESEVRFTAASDPVLVADMFPRLRFRMPDGLHDLSVQRCLTLAVDTPSESGLRTKETGIFPSRLTIYVSDAVPDTGVLGYLIDRFSLDIGQAEREQILESGRVVVGRGLVRRIRACESDAERLVVAIGEMQLRRHLPEGLMELREARGEDVSPLSVAEMYLAVHGIDALRVLRQELLDANLEPPRRWAGSQTARKYVTDLGFAEVYAGLPPTRRDPFLDVIGPVWMPPMHEFQREASQELLHVLNRKVAPARGIVELPTGAGKTRIAVETITDWLVDGDRDGVVLWVAQSDELCEQAVQAWGEIWASFGSVRDTLRVSRLWAEHGARRSDTRRQVVVATMGKLTSVIRTAAPDYAWLADPLCVVIDEAHHTTTPSYTKVLDWLMLGRTRDSRPLIGLTATAYRGYSQTETEQLARRYGERRIWAPSLGDNPYEELQRIGVLCEVDHEAVEGSDVKLDEREIGELAQFGVLPRSAERRLGLVPDRNDAIVERVLRLPTDWPTLVFATSVDHAKLLAGVLCAEDVRAAVVSGETDTSARRHYAEQFRAGEIQVMVNYGVFTTGFDAPAIRAVMVARPVFSPGLYQQMIGRGLRGPANGGKERCLIINIADNFERYGRTLAFHHFDDLWGDRSADRDTDL